MRTDRHNISITTSTGGTATLYSEDLVNARILSIHYVATDIPATGVLTLTGEVTGQTIWSQLATGSMVRVPRQPVNSAAGASATAFREPFYVAEERLKIVVAGGGSEKTGQIYIITG